ncbi:glycosyltransferase family 2 protein [Lactiplantibacillus plantarum]|uniref:glycosyltransferase family 2 protein n=1 Tax=Lactiplantibacillus plantarum TaxID=1590 RepID=UPI0039C2E3C7
MISFVILNYMAVKRTMKTVDEILQLDGPKNVVIVDNASPNGSFKLLKARYRSNPSVTLIYNKHNLGFAKGNNIGYLVAKKSNPDFIVVMNSDMDIIQNNLIERIYKSYATHRFHIMGPDIIKKESGEHQNPQKDKFNLQSLEKLQKKLVLKNRLKFLFWIRWHLFPNLHKEKRISKDRVTKTVTNCVLHGSFYVFSQDFIKDNSTCFFDKTFMYMESYILYHVATKKKYVLIYDPSIEVLHDDDASTNVSHNSRYSKAVFSNKALLQSTNEFIKLLRSE